MKTKQYHLFVLGLAFLVAFSNVAHAEDDLKPTIQYLLNYVGKSNVVFIRNDSEHTAKEAVEHIKKKYNHFKDKIKTPEDFIRLSATKSMFSGNLYKIKTKGGKIIPCRQWLLSALRTYRQNKTKKDKPSG